MPDKIEKWNISGVWGMNFSSRLTKDYEEAANRKLAGICRIAMILLFVVMLLNYFNVFIIDDVIYPVLTFSIIVMLLPTFFYNVRSYNSLLIRYFVLTLVVFMSGLLYAFLSYHVIIMLVFPIVVSCLYCDKKSVIYTALIGIPVIVVSHLLAFQFKVVPDEPLVTLKGTIFYGILPRVLEYTSIVIVCFSMTNKVQALIENLIKKNDELYKEQEGIITSLSTMIENESQETGMHVKRVSEYTKILCRGLGFSDEIVWKVGLAAMMHDVGKILIPHDILEKPGKLTKEEFEVIKKHTVYGKRMLENSQGELMKLSAIIAYEHHERWDGTGYANMKGEDIDIYSRCVSVADVFDALVSWRPYKNPWTPEDARAEIVSQAGKQFDPAIVKLFDENFDEFIEIYEKYPDSLEEQDSDAILR